MTDLVAVTQADRDAVQAFHREMGRRLMSDIRSGTSLLDAKGEDSEPIYQAFARHRIAAEARSHDAEWEGMRSALKRIVDDAVGAKDGGWESFTDGYSAAKLESAAIARQGLSDRASV